MDMNTKLLVRVVKDWHSPNFFRQSPNSSGKFGNIQFTEEEIDTCDYLICLNPPPQRLEVKAKQAWLVTQEPPVEYYKWHTPAFKHFDKVFTQHQTSDTNLIHAQGVLPWHVGRTYDELVSIPVGEKLDRVSTITSNAYERPGHKARYDLIQFLRDEEFGLELFGRGIRFIEDKFDGLYPFKYSIAIENSFYQHYWTEKISDCFLAWNMPIYAGCPNITDYFPKESMILIDPFDQQTAKAQIEEAIRNDHFTKNFDALKQARDLVLNEYQFFPRMSKLIEEAEQNSSSQRAIKIPAFKRPFSLKRKIKIWKKKLLG